MSGETTLWPLLLLAALVIALGAALAGQIRQRNALRDWLAAPELQTIPDGSGAWREIFSRLQALRKQERRQQFELGNALERFRLTIQALPAGVMLLDGQLRIVWLNDAACRHFALDAARDPGTLVSQLIRQSEFQQLAAAYRAHPSRQSAQLRVAGNDGERVLSVILIPFSEGETLLVSTDVTEQVRTETIRRDFIANVSHELRTPLTVISGFLEQFDTATPPTGEAARAFIRLMAEQAERMKRLIADLLTLSRLENSELPPSDETVDIAALVAALRTEALALSAGQHTIETAELSDAKLRGSADELRSAFGNLIFNAVRYTPAGGRITLAWRIVDGQPTFSVTDTGIGIAAEHIPRLTERFYRVDKGRATASGGTGLGLAIVKHVLARHGGRLEITSVPGRGSTFTCRFPVERSV
ncbi:phosphate regulon sensor histidine kinase PhoR [Sulfuricystis thermophila]|uniref:phosphate regulon sensor histidine kinase PhoR n=1 Tax=Sulfuricystis thermophila TaxID=2496847 RepID=UPI001035DDE8|nr:phosphate regulon sensor histidine kinase PhoR [Sulfuricystis thermophila]